jgi:platelet-activating factor acetylhydrolase
MYTKLPEHRGKYQVGFIDVETKPKDILPDQGLFFRIYYPTETKIGYTSWLPNNWEYSKGYGNFLKSSKALIGLLYYPFFSLVKMRMEENVPMASIPKVPVCVFSHGLAGMRTTYSNLCGNLASRGCIVVAIEHGDGSACYTKRSLDQLEIHHHHPSKEELRENETENEYLLRLRSTQLNHRRDEILEALTLIDDIEKGDLKHVLLRENGFDEPFLTGLKNRLDFDNMMIMGHSFGVFYLDKGATTIHTLNTQVKPFKCAVIMDPWMFAVPPNSVLKIPTLNVQSHIFHWKKNLDAIKEMESHADAHPESQFALIKDTKHNDFSDFSMAFTRVLTFAKQAGPADPIETHAIQDEIAMEFLSKYIQFPVKHEKDPSVNVERVVYGQEAFQELYAKL